MKLQKGSGLTLHLRGRSHSPVSTGLGTPHPGFSRDIRSSPHSLTPMALFCLSQKEQKTSGEEHRACALAPICSGQPILAIGNGSS